MSSLISAEEIEERKKKFFRHINKKISNLRAIKKKSKNKEPLNQELDDCLDGKNDDSEDDSN